jgi:hypothetical protein
MSEPPVRPDLAPGIARPHRRWLPPLVVLGVILFVTLGGWVLAAALAKPAGPPVGFPGIATEQPLSGWQDAGTSIVAGAPLQRLTRGGANLDLLVVSPFEGDETSLAQNYVTTVLHSRLTQLSVSDHLTSVTLDNGMRGMRFAYVGVSEQTGGSVEGEVTVVVTPAAHGVVFDAWAPEGLLSFAQGDTRTMIVKADVE